MDTLVYRVKEVDVEAPSQSFAELDVETLIYELAHRLRVVEEVTFRNRPTKVDCKAVLHTLAVSETEVNSTYLTRRCPSKRAWKRSTHLLT